MNESAKKLAYKILKVLHPQFEVGDEENEYLAKPDYDRMAPILTAALTAAQNAGREEMREAAAHEADEWRHSHHRPDGTWYTLKGHPELAKAIRALTLPPVEAADRPRCAICGVRGPCKHLQATPVGGGRGMTSVTQCNFCKRTTDFSHVDPDGSWHTLRVDAVPPFMDICPACWKPIWEAIGGKSDE